MLYLIILVVGLVAGFAAGNADGLTAATDDLCARLQRERVREERERWYL